MRAGIFTRCSHLFNPFDDLLTKSNAILISLVTIKGILFTPRLRRLLHRGTLATTPLVGAAHLTPENNTIITIMKMTITNTTTIITSNTTTIIITIITNTININIIVTMTTLQLRVAGSPRATIVSDGCSKITGAETQSQSKKCRYTFKQAREKSISILRKHIQATA